MPVAILDLDQIAARIALDNPDGAVSVADRIERRAASLTSLSERGRIVPELASHGVHSYRELIVGAWRLVYRVESERVVVLAVFDGRRNLEDVLLDRLLASPGDETAA